MARLDLVVHGMDCAEEVATVRRALEPMVGVEDLAFDLLRGRLSVSYESTSLGPDEIVAAITRTGLRTSGVDDPRSDEATARDRRRRSAFTIASGALLLSGFLLDALARGGKAAFGLEEGAPSIAARIAYLCAVATGAVFVLPKAWNAVRTLRADMNLLMTIAVAGAVAIGETLEAATVTALFALSLTLESWSVGRSRRAIEALVSLAPPKARVRDAGGNESLVDPGSVGIGDRFLVNPGERVPLDGRVVAGTTAVDQSPITGESAPVEKSVGDEVFAGSLVHDGAVEVEALKPWGRSVASQIVKMVAEAQARRSPTERWVERFARWYTPAILALSVAVAVIPTLAGGDARTWLYQALVLLVIGCPCALVISTPMTMMSALTAAARHGVLVKGADTIEVPAHLVAVALDKTGTLTEGRPEVARVVPLSGHDEREVLEIAAAIEARSQHPLGRAIVRHAARGGIQPAEAEDHRVVPGRGALARVSGREAWIGSHRLLEERGQETPAMHEVLDGLAAEGLSVVVVGEEDHACGFIALADRVRSEAAEAVRSLKAAGIERIVMLTGDNRATADAVARETGVDEVRAEMLPQEKVAAVEDLLGRYERVAMVGDGVNDAPALARATLGVAMGAAGSEAAVETADVALMTEDLRRVPWLIRHSTRTIRILRQNVGASIGVKVIFVGLTFLGVSSLWGAIAADMGVSLLVVANALRLLRSGDLGG